MKLYIYTINLHTENSRPSYQVAHIEIDEKTRTLKEILQIQIIETKNLRGVGFTFMPPNTMPSEFIGGDQISFFFIGRQVTNCVIYFRPVFDIKKEEKIPVTPKYPEGLGKSDSKWQVTLIDSATRPFNDSVTYLIVDESGVGRWSFVLAGKFLSFISDDCIEDLWVEMPFLLDPECVVKSK